MARPRESSKLRLISAYEPRTAAGGVTPWVFYPALVLIAGISVLTIAYPDEAGEVLSTIQNGIVGTFGWYYVLIVALFVVVSIWLGVSRFGGITLGKDNEGAEFSLKAWFAMLFAAGMGIGLVFFGAAEPLMHYDSPKPGIELGEAADDRGFGAEGIGSAGADLADDAMAQTFVHWGVHAWAIYVVVGLSLAYAIHRKGRPVSIRWALEPLLGARRVRGWLGDVIDVVAILGTLFGVATSLGIGVQQIGSGLVSMGVIGEAGDGVLVLLIAIITAIATISVVTGVHRGIRWLSNVNLVLAAVFVVFIAIVGPTLFFFREFVQSLGVYVQNVLPFTFETTTYMGQAGQDWQSSWTVFYWGWWMSWAPFVGIFIARISRGRTIREFVAGVLVVPTLVTFVWFTVLGGSSLYQHLFGEGGLVNRESDDPFERVVPENALFNMLEGLPWSGILMLIAVVMVTIFFITSSDSGSLVVDMLASGGDTEPPTWSRVLFCVLEGVVAASLLLAGGLEALRTGAITTALPFSVVILLMLAATYRSLRAEHLVLRAASRRKEREELERHVSRQMTSESSGSPG
ncbi:BCCT family transporter [Actinobacteria bacterium YIM 96077]|uniref:BCCT family transporter n=1 Tax=Phytoactinopolyspora halophila TaxID=1981511 RepID=A0A329QR85_9ACTN|nr:BCCT family transporter [Phytoactinopolyspora halophila]AYY14324.1 BCCT family transporter [Actinobacteria bacterium YIM 96077]RAW14867.1 BCCT family transporter [Phytoactinopolyspora halophila]